VKEMQSREEQSKGTIILKCVNLIFKKDLDFGSEPPVGFNSPKDLIALIIILLGLGLRQ